MIQKLHSVRMFRAHFAFTRLPERLLSSANLQYRVYVSSSRFPQTYRKQGSVFSSAVNVIKRS